MKTGAWQRPPLERVELWANTSVGTSVAVRPSGYNWIACLLAGGGPVFSPPTVWERLPGWFAENDLDVAHINELQPLGELTSIFDVYGVDRAGVPNERETPIKNQRVYFIQCGETGPIKIGIAVDVKRRMAGLQTACPFPLRLLATASGGAKLEAEFHRQFAGDRLRGEWFLPTTELLQLVEAFA